MVVHHFKKDLDIPVGHRFRGSGDWGAVVDVIIEFDRTDDGAKLTYEGRRGAPVDPLHLAWFHHGYTATSATADNPPSSADNRIAKIDAAIRTYLDEHPDGVSGHAVRKAIAGRAKVVIARLKAIGVRREDGLWVGCSATPEPAPPEQPEQPVPEVVPEVVPPLFPQHGTTGTGVVPEVVPVVPAPIGEQPIGNNPPAVPEVVPEAVPVPDEGDMSMRDDVLARVVAEIQDALDDHPLALPVALSIYAEGLGVEPEQISGDMLVENWGDEVSRAAWLELARERLNEWAAECTVEETDCATGTVADRPMEKVA